MKTPVYTQQFEVVSSYVTKEQESSYSKCKNISVAREAAGGAGAPHPRARVPSKFAQFTGLTSYCYKQ